MSSDDYKYDPAYDARPTAELPVITTSGFADFTDADLQSALANALRTIAVMAAVAAPFLAIMAGWQTAALFLVGGIVAAAGLWEWRSLVTAVTERLEANPDRPPRPITSILVRFSLRLVFVAAALYVSLRCLHGSAYALLAGLGLAVVAVTIQAVKLLRRWA